MRVFIENEAGSNQKNIFDEKTLEYKKTVTISGKYPYPYGFILDTTSGDGDNLDVFVITNNKLKTGQVVECEAVGLMEQVETTLNGSKGDINEQDHKVLAVFADEDIVIDGVIRNKLKQAVLRGFDHLPNKKIQVNGFLNKRSALEYIEKCKDN